MLEPILFIRDQQLSTIEIDEVHKSNMFISLLCGYVGSNSFRVKGETYQMLVLSRVSCKRTGARYMARGIDDDGNVSNFVETEFVILSRKFLFSFLQICPLFWEQTGIQLSHRVEMARSLEATRKHIEEMLERYNRIHVVNLLKQDPWSNEFALYNSYKSALGKFQDLRDVVAYTEFDFSAIVKRDNYERVYYLTNPLQQTFDDYGYFLYDRESDIILKLQNGVFRTNCLDCLDRTNVVQTYLCSE